MKKFLLMALCALTFSSAYSKVPEILSPEYNMFEFKHNPLRPNKIKIGNHTLKNEIPERNYQVLNYDLSLDWFDLLNNPSAKTFTGTNRIRLVTTKDNVSSIDLDATRMTITDILVNNVVMSISPQPINNVLSIPVPSAKLGDTIEIAVSYKVVGNNDMGLFAYPKGLYTGKPNGLLDSSFVEENLAYLMSEPEDARYWMPCNDRQSDKAVASISVRMPLGYTCASNGLIVSDTKDDSTRTMVWSDTTQIATYLMSATASKFVEYSDYYKRVSNPNDSIPVMYYIWAKDSTNELTTYKVFNATNSFRRTTKMMAFYSNLFVEYPFQKYGMVSVYPFGFGGMEHQTMTTVTRTWLQGRSETGIAHELAHQWLGDLITCDSWNDIWINEGGATWSEALWLGQVNTPNEIEDYYYGNMVNNSNYYFYFSMLDSIPIYGINNADLFNQPYYYLVYNKASWIYHMLKEMLGDEFFFTTLRGLMNNYAYSSVSSEQFRDFFVEKLSQSNMKPPMDLNVFFDQWLYKAGHPIYETTLQTIPKGDGKYIANINLKQVQTNANGPDVFVMPIEFYFYNSVDSTSYSVKVFNDSLEQNYSLEVPGDFTHVIVDNWKVLCKTNFKGKISGINDEEQINISVYPNPATDILSIAYSDLQQGTIEIIDIFGNRVLSSSFDGNSGLSSQSINVASLPQGSYFVRINSGNKVVNKQFNVVR